MIKSLSPCRYADIVFYTFNYLDKKCPCSKNLYFHENNNIHKMYTQNGSGFTGEVVLTPKDL